MVWRKRKQPVDEPPSGPPDPAAIRQQMAQEKKNKRAQTERIIKSKVLPHVDAALHSSKQVSYEVGELRLEIVGSKSGVHIYSEWGTHGWVKPLLKALRADPYQGYTVSLWGDHTHSRHPVKKLDENNIAESLRKFQRTYRYGYALVQIAP